MNIKPKNSKFDLLSSAAFGLFLALIASIAAVYSYNIYAWGEYPDFGYGFRTASGLSLIGEVSENGRKAGFEVHDRILTVNGESHATMRELRSHMRRNLGETNTYLIERQGRRLEISIVNVPTGLKAVFYDSGFLFLLGLGYAFIGTTVFLMQPNRRTSWIFMLFTGTLGIWMFFLFKSGALTPIWFENIHILAYCFMPAVFLHMALSFPLERRIIRDHPYIQVIPYTVSLLLFAMIRIETSWLADVPRPLLITLVVYMAFAVLLYLGSNLQLRITSKSELVKSRSKIILLGSAIAALVPLTDFISSALLDAYILPSFNFYLPFFIFFPLSIAYAIVKHDLFDIDAIIKRTYGYVLTTGALAGVYGLFVLVGNFAFGGYEFARSPLFSIVFIMSVVFLFNPVRDRVQRFIDRVFYRLEYDYQSAVHQISETMRSLLSLDQIGRNIMDTALGTMFIDHGYVLLLSRDGETYDCLVEAGKAELTGGKRDPEEQPDKEMACGPEVAELKLPSEEPLIRKIAETGKEVTVYDIEEDPVFEGAREECRRAFARMQAQLLVPLFYENRLSGLIALGRKKSGKFYRREDINLLNVLANQGAVAIENARMVQDVVEKERMEEELSIARDLQVSMLPAECPQVPGFEIAACSMSAREVGGDFYDFIEMGGSRLGIVIGDVTGKSVSGALVMSASRSVFRMLSEEELTVGRRMIRANHRLKKDLKSGMFVALLYAVLDSDSKTLSLCSAGQTQPVMRTASRRSTCLVETRGDAFPLGILDEAEYEETLMNIDRGDVIVFYTDGIVEAMNAKGELFGFERLVSLIDSSVSDSAETLLQDILAHTKKFASGVAQHDDLTVIVVRCSSSDSPI
jgi:serine phosphatase RsbU (regulator of sigma subunit)